MNNTKANYRSQIRVKDSVSTCRKDTHSALVRKECFTKTVNILQRSLTEKTPLSGKTEKSATNRMVIWPPSRPIQVFGESCPEPRVSVSCSRHSNCHNVIHLLPAEAHGFRLPCNIDPEKGFPFTPARFMNHDQRLGSDVYEV